MLIDTDDIITKSGIAHLLGVTAPAVSNWKKRPVGFPEPIKVIQTGRGQLELYDKKTVIAWYDARMSGHLTPEMIDARIEHLQNLKKEMTNVEDPDTHRQS